MPSPCCHTSWAHQCFPSCLRSLRAAASRAQSRQPHSPANHTCRELWSPGAGVSEIPGKGFPAFPFFFFFLHECSLFTPYCIWQSQEERRRREKRHKVCRGEKRGVIVNVCLSLAGGTAPPWDAGFPAPRAASLLCRRQRGLLWERPCSGSGSSHCTERWCWVSLAVSPSAATRTPLIINRVRRQASRVMASQISDTPNVEPQQGWRLMLPPLLKVVSVVPCPPVGCARAPAAHTPHPMSCLWAEGSAQGGSFTPGTAPGASHLLCSHPSACGRAGGFWGKPSWGSINQPYCWACWQGAVLLSIQTHFAA